MRAMATSTLSRPSCDHVLEVEQQCQFIHDKAVCCSVGDRERWVVAVHFRAAHTDCPDGGKQCDADVVVAHGAQRCASEKI